MDEFLIIEDVLLGLNSSVKEMKQMTEIYSYLSGEYKCYISK